MWKKWLRAAAILALIAVPLGVWWLYEVLTAFPDQVTIAAGTAGGRYRVLADRLKDAVQDQLDVEVVILETDGSLDNLLRLRNGEADFAFYQSGTVEVLREHERKMVEKAEAAAGLESAADGTQYVAFVANLYMQPAHLIVRSGSEIEQPADLRGRPISVGLERSGDYAMSLVLLEHLGLARDDIDARHLAYADLVAGLAGNQPDEAEQLDAACYTVGSPAPFLTDLFKTGDCRLLEIPHTKALTRKRVFLSEYTIPAGLHHSQPPARPAQDVHTVAVPAQLLARSDVNPLLVHEVTRIVLAKQFALQNDLHELLDLGRDFAGQKTAFAVHDGAQSVYDPEFDIHLIESWEAAYSLTASLAIAAFFGFRSLRRTRERKTEHKLDRYVHALLHIEERQVGLGRGTSSDDLEPLQRLLDKVTTLRQTALREFSIHELNEDRGPDCFIEMCHALSNKINAKISRLRFDATMRDLINATRDCKARDRKDAAGAEAADGPTS